MNIFKKLYEMKKREMEVKQGKHGVMQKYMVLIPLFLLYWYKALFMPGREVYLVLLIPITIILPFFILRDIKEERNKKK